MHVRPMTRDDLPRVTDIDDTAFIDEELFSHLAPRRYDYHLAWRQFLKVSLRQGIVQPSVYPIVVVDWADRVLGYAWWKRQVPKDKAPGDPLCQNNKSFGALVERNLLAFQSKIENTFKLNTCVDYGVCARYFGNESIFAPLEAGVTHWHLTAIAVDPEHQRKGIGHMMVQWGLDLAQEESRETGIPVPAVLVALVRGRGLYEKFGFKVNDYILVGDKKDSHVTGGCGMVWDPSQAWVRPAMDHETMKGLPVEVMWTEATLESGKSASKKL